MKLIGLSMKRFKLGFLKGIAVMVLALYSHWSSASHILGGEITYKCLGGGLFEFTIKVYRDCAGVPWSQTALALQGPHGTTNLPILPGSPDDISPRCPGNNYLSCNPPANASNQNQGSVARYIFRGIVDLSALGPPPASGYTFNTTQSGSGIPCCRPSIDNSSASNGNQTLRVTMFPFRDPNTNTVLSPAQLCDNSSEFATDPTSFAVLNPIDTIFLQSLAFDSDLDSTRFSMDFPLGTSISAPYSFSGTAPNGLPYSITNPLPGLLGAPVISPANSPINLISGEIAYQPIVLGTFVMVIKVSSYRCNQLISEVFRDFNLKIIPNAPTSPPVFDPAGPLQGIFSQRPPIIKPPSITTSGLPSFEGIYYAGDTIQSFVNVEDPFPSLSGNPNDPTTWVPNQSSIGVFVKGSQLAIDHPNYLACPRPPCARLQGISDNTLPPVPPTIPASIISYGNGTQAGYGFSGIVQSGAKLVWATNCDNLPQIIPGCGTLFSSNKFQINAFDNNCPVEGRESRVYIYKLINTPVLPPVRLRGVSVAPSNDSVTVYWDKPFGPPGSLIDTVTIDSLDILNNPLQTPAFCKMKSINRRKYTFKNFRLYRQALDIQTGISLGPWIQVDSSSVLDSNKVIDASASLDLTNFDYMYKVGVVSRCDSVEVFSDSLKIIRGSLSFNRPTSFSTFTWDSMALRNPYIPSNCLPFYYIQKKVVGAGGIAFTYIDTFNVNGVNPYLYNENSVIVCRDTLAFRAGLPDVNGTVYWSTVPSQAVEQVNNIAPVNLRRVSVDTLSNYLGEFGISMNWDVGPSLALGGYNIYHVPDSSQPLADSIEQVWGFNTNQHTVFNAAFDPTQAPVWLTIAGEDSCRISLGSFDTSNYHNTMYNYSEFQYCGNSRGFKLYWNHYYKWYPEILRYNVYRSSALNPTWNLVNSITPVSYDSINKFVDASLSLNSNEIYCYFIEAVKMDGTRSFSNISCDTFFLPVLEHNRLRQVTVDTSSGVIKLKYVFKPLEIAKNFIIQRRTQLNTFSNIWTFSNTDFDLTSGVPIYNFIDSNVQTSLQKYCYRIVVYDLCDAPLDTSDEFCSIFLTARYSPIDFPEFTTELNWNLNTNWPQGVDSLRYYRNIAFKNVPDNFLFRKTILSPVQNTDFDKVVPTNDIMSLARFDYYLEAFEKDPIDEDLIPESISSNISRAQHPPRIFLPTAFTPNSNDVNKLFFPAGFFIDYLKDYRMEIYNRWGQLQFETNDFFTGWNGKNLNGEDVDMGTYVVRVMFTGKNEQLYYYNSTCTLVK